MKQKTKPSKYTIDGMNSRELTEYLNKRGIETNNNKVIYLIRYRGITEMKKLISSIKDLKDGKRKIHVDARYFDVKVRGKIKKMASSEVWAIHPFKKTVSRKLVLQRLIAGHGVKGTLWSDIASPKKPRKKPEKKPKIIIIEKPKGLQRGKACFRRAESVIRERCKWYWELTETFGLEEKPDRCLKATDECENYEGEKLKKIHVDVSGIQNDPGLMPTHNKFMGTGER